MNKYKITIVERLTRAIHIDAESAESAKSIIEQAYYNQEYTLTSDDFLDAEFEVEED